MGPLEPLEPLEGDISVEDLGEVVRMARVCLLRLPKKTLTLTEFRLLSTARESMIYRYRSTARATVFQQDTIERFQEKISRAMQEKEQKVAFIRRDHGSGFSKNVDLLVN